MKVLCVLLLLSVAQFEEKAPKFATEDKIRVAYAQGNFDTVLMLSEELKQKDSKAARVWRTRIIDFRKYALHPENVTEAQAKEAFKFEQSLKLKEPSRSLREVRQRFIENPLERAQIAIDAKVPEKAASEIEAVLRVWPKEPKATALKQKLSEAKSQ